MAVWFVAARNPTLAAFLDNGCAAVNFWIRADASTTDADALRQAVAPPDREASPRTRTLFANQLMRFSEIAVDDQIVSFDHRDRQTIHVGTVTEPYRYDDPPTLPDHPHVICVAWEGTIGRDELPDAGAAIPSTPGISVAPVYDLPLNPSPAPPTRTRPTTPLRVSRARTIHRRHDDGFGWEPRDGSHRLTLTHTFGREGQPRDPFVVVMLNPGKNDPIGFRTSTTCHRVRAWGQAHNFDGAVYINLFTIVVSRAHGLCDYPTDALNAANADDVIRSVATASTGPLIAGWGGVPKDLDHRLFNRRIDEVRQLLQDQPIYCLGRTAAGYPKHGMRWHPADQLEPL